MLPLVFAAACTTSETEAPALAGPSELGMSLAIAANPDILTKDGSSQSTILITVRNSEGQPASGVPLRVETAVGGALLDYGRLSTKSVSTGSDGRASVVYTAPSGPLSGNSQDDETVVTFTATPVGTNFSNAIARSITIRLMPAGVILPPAGRPIARFTFAPTSPTEGQDVSFDASGSLDCPSGVTTLEQCASVGSKVGLSYAWEFGDGTTGTGVQVTHRYSRTGSYSVALTVSNERGNSDRTSSFVNVGAGTAPTASFTFSPSSPQVGQSVFFNASPSTAAAGRTIVGYDWTFGDGGTGAGATVTHRFGNPGSWVVTLTVTDDAGKTGSVSQAITLGADIAPTADFSLSPSEPRPGDTVQFDGRLSQAPGGRTLTRWEWNFGDGATGEGEVVSHTYPLAGTYTVTLTVTDSTGVKKTAAKTFTVKVPTAP